MYLQIDEDVLQARRTLSFCARLRDQNAVAYLIRLWAWAVRHNPGGDMTGLCARTIEDIAGYRPLDGRCHRALVDSGFIGDDAGRTTLLNWLEHVGPAKREYGPNWREIRATVIRRDKGACVECGADDRLDVHHIRPLRLFKGDHEAANVPTNLKTLCRSCHAAADVDVRRQERRS